MSRLGLNDEPPPSRHLHLLPSAAEHRLLWTRFRRHKLARFGISVIAAFAMAGLLADFISSELPVAGRIHGQVYILPNLTHPSRLSGFTQERIRSEREASDWSLETLVAYGPNEAAPDRALMPPALTKSHPFGTDRHGRDVVARLVHGIRTTLGIGFATTLLFTSLGVALGAIAGYFGGVFDRLVTRLVEIFAAFPPLLFALVVQALLRQPSPLILIFALAVTRWTEIARLVRAEVLQAMSSEYVLAARALGASPWRVLGKHILPNSLVPVWVNATYGFASVVLVEASIHFLRGRESLSTLSWGEMMSEARGTESWWLFAFPGLAIFFVVGALNLIGEAVRDAFDPQLQFTKRGAQKSIDIPFSTDRW